jgi:hypothetical protein
VIPWRWRWRWQVPPNQSAEKSDAKLSLLTQKLITTFIRYYALLQKSIRHLPAKFYYQITTLLTQNILITAFNYLISI